MEIQVKGLLHKIHNRAAPARKIGIAPFGEVVIKKELVLRNLFEERDRIPPHGLHLACGGARGIEIRRRTRSRSDFWDKKQTAARQVQNTGPRNDLRHAVIVNEVDEPNTVESESGKESADRIFGNPKMLLIGVNPPYGENRFSARSIL